MRSRVATALVAVFGFAVVATLAGPPLVRGVLWRRELNPELRGLLLARSEGCVACHRPWSRREIPNPGSRWGSVPRFASGNARMYAASRAELEEFIRFGAPRAWLDDPAARERLAAQRLRMPAYGERLTDRQIADLVAFVAVVEKVELAGGEEAVAGREIASKSGCLACHGVEGSGGLSNPGSLGGFVPGFLGRNFDDLVRDEAEFRQWVLDGTSRRLEANPIVRRFWRRQAIAMPAYRGELDGEDLDALWRWVELVRRPREPAGSPDQ